MEAFINSIGIISPQNTFTSKGFPAEIVSSDVTISLKCIEPSYKEYLDPMASRRMSRIVKMGLCAAMKCLKEAEIEVPDAIITGTGFGCIEDTEKFLGSIFTNEEKLLNPTPFIQSTHNTIGAAIALKIKCNNYNSTYAHKGFSFEHALIDSLMILNEGSGENVLVGGIDETTNNFLTITKRIGFWKRNPVNNLNLFDNRSKGTIAGEGAAFFMIGAKNNEKTYAKINNLHTFYQPDNFIEVENQIAEFLNRSDISLNELDLVILGNNGDYQKDEVYYHLMKNKFSAIPVAIYKHLCGEYDTSSSFALWLASVILKNQVIPEIVKRKKFDIKKINKILIYNHLRNINHSLILLSKC